MIFFAYSLSAGYIGSERLYYSIMAVPACTVINAMKYNYSTCIRYTDGIVFCNFAICGRNALMKSKEPTVLDNITFSLDIPPLLQMLGIKEGSESASEFEGMARQAQSIASPKAMFRAAYIDDRTDDSVTIDGVLFMSALVADNLKNVHHVFPFVTTCGTELDKWAQRYNEVLQSFWADTIMALALGSAIKALTNHLGERFGAEKLSIMNPGSLPEWPITGQKPLFELLGDVESHTGVRLNESFLMIPVKSVSGIYFQSEVSFINCQLCERERCPGRRAPFDKEKLTARSARK